MSSSWYYVRGSDRIGPIEESELIALFRDGTLNDDSYVWTKGFDNWQKARTVDQLQDLLNDSASNVTAAPIIPTDSSAQELARPALEDLSSLPEEKVCITIKIGRDRGLAEEIEYGPYSLEQLRRAYKEKRINGKTFIYVPGMDNWQFLAETPLFNRITSDMPPIIDDSERRQHVRKPFVARLLFHDTQEVYEGVCRDISIGGLQVLVGNFPCRVGDEIKLNVHPENDAQSFTATGKVVRLLDGGQGFSLRFYNLGEHAIKAIQTYIG